MSFFFSRQHRRKRNLFLTLLLTVLVLFVLIRHLTGTQTLAQTFAKAHWQWLWIPFTWMTINLFFAGLRWYLILVATGYPIPFSRIMFAVLATWPLALITPSRASDLLRAWCIRDQVPLAQGTGSVMAEKVIDLQSLGLYTLLGSILTGLWFWGLAALVALLSLWIIILALLHALERILQHRWLQRWHDPIRRFFVVFHALQQKPRSFVTVCFFSMVGWAGALGIITSLLWIFGCDLTTSQILTLWPIAMFLGHIPITFAGMGTRDAAFLSLVWISSQQIHPQSNILAATLTYALITTVYPAILGIPFMFRFLQSWDNRVPESFSTDAAFPPESSDSQNTRQNATTTRELSIPQAEHTHGNTEYPHGEPKR